MDGLDADTANECNRDGVNADTANECNRGGLDTDTGNEWNRGGLDTDTGNECNRGGLNADTAELERIEVMMTIMRSTLFQLSQGDSSVNTLSTHGRSAQSSLTLGS